MNVELNPFLGPQVKCKTGRCKYRTSTTINANGICSRHTEGVVNMNKARLWEMGQTYTTTYNKRAIK